MKRLFAILLLIMLLITISGCARIRIPKGEQAVLTYREPVVGSPDAIVATITAEESAKVREILMGAKHNPGIGGCHYTEEISLTFGEQMFLVACDGCNTICDRQNEKYYVVDMEDWEYIVSLFERYGGRI
jgi:hypothetical protein